MKSFVSKEREEEYRQISQKHLTAFGMELKEHGFCPVPAFIGCDALYELDYVMKQEKLSKLPDTEKNTLGS